MGKLVKKQIWLQGDTLLRLRKIAKLAHTDVNTTVSVILATEVLKIKKNQAVKTKS